MRRESSISILVYIVLLSASLAASYDLERRPVIRSQRQTVTNELATGLTGTGTSFNSLNSQYPYYNVGQQTYMNSYDNLDTPYPYASNSWSKYGSGGAAPAAGYGYGYGRGYGTQYGGYGHGVGRDKWRGFGASHGPSPSHNYGYGYGGVKG